MQDEESAGKSAEAGEAKEAEAGRLLRELSLAWFEDEQLAPAYAGDAPLQWEVGPRTRIRSYRDEYGDDGAFEKCMYWAPKTYQRDVCLMDVDWFLDTVMLIDGTLYKQRFQQVDFPRGVVTYPFFHFQEWKKSWLDPVGFRPAFGVEPLGQAPRYSAAPRNFTVSAADGIALLPRL